MAREVTLTQRQLNRAVLARQLLLERSTRAVPRVLELVAGLQSQYAPSMYIGLWSRVAGFSREDLTASLHERSVVQGTLMRATIHLVSARDYWPFALAFREARQSWWLRTRPEPLTAEVMAAAARELRDHLGDGPLRADEIERIVGRSRAAGVGLWIDLVRAPPSGTWERRRANLFAAAEDWIGPPDATVIRDDAVRHLVRRYLGGFGPATSRDIVDFSGLAAADVTGALEHLGLRRFRDDSGSTLYDLPGAPRPDPDTTAPVRFLPTFDATLLVHARRAGIVPEQYRPLLFNTKTPQSVPTFLVDGAVAGTWKYGGGHIDLKPFGRLDSPTRRQLDDEAGRLAAMHA